MTPVILIGGNNLGKAKNSTQRKANYNNSSNTIDFNQNYKNRPRHIELIPKSLGQEKLILDLTDPSQSITVAVGPAGTGKTYLAMLAAIKNFREGRCQRIILTRPAIGVEGEQHGFLPGDLTSKMEPWTRPLLDVMKEYYSTKEVVQMIENEIIEVAPLAFMRGRTFKDSWIVADEMQNATPEQCKMLLTRIGEHSRIVVTGDVEQADRFGSKNGLLDLCSRLENQECNGISVNRLQGSDIQRHPIIDTVLDLYSE